MRIKSPLCAFILLFSVIFAYGQAPEPTKQQRLGRVAAYRGSIIPMKSIRSIPADIASPSNDVTKLTDGINTGEGNQFHTPWGGIPKQEVSIEVDLDGSGKTLSSIVLDQRFLGRGGIITDADILVMTNGIYKKVAEIQPKALNQRVTVSLKKPVKNPEKVKLVIKNTSTDNGSYQVCLGEMACLEAPAEKPVKSTITFIPNLNDEQRQGLELRTNLLKTVPEYAGTPIKLSHFSVSPQNAAAEGNDAELLADGFNYGDYTEFHTPWGGMPQQDIVIEADLDGQGKRLDQIVLDQRHLGLGGIITQGSLWVMTKNKYVKVSDIDADVRNGRLIIIPSKKIRNPQKIKLIVTDSFSDNGNFMVCLGELACISKKR